LLSTASTDVNSISSSARTYFQKVVIFTIWMVWYNYICCCISFIICSSLVIYPQIWKSKYGHQVNIIYWTKLWVWRRNYVCSEFLTGTMVIQDMQVETYITSEVTLMSVVSWHL
jgi:hypothetical protein